MGYTVTAKIAPNQQAIPVAKAILVAKVNKSVSTSVEPNDNTISHVRYNSLVVVIPVKEGGCLRENSEKKKNKPRREYRFSIFVDDHLVGITEPQSYSELKDRFSMFHYVGITEPQSYGHSTAKFPGSMFMKNTTTNEKNTMKRASDIATYIQSILRHYGNIGRSSLHDALNIQALYKDHCVSIFLEIHDAQRVHYLAVRKAQEARRLAILASQKADQQFAQTFNQLVRNGPPLAPGQISTITFDHTQRFTLRNRMWSGGSADISGPGPTDKGLPWFQMLRTGGGYGGWGEIMKNCQFTICNMAGEPLMSMEERFSWRNYVYDLYRYDPHRPGQQIPVCRISRVWSFGITDQYHIELYGPMAHHPPIFCSGRWPSQFTLSNQRGGIFAKVEKQMFSWTDKYHVTIAAGQDCLLFTSIACAIDRIHHEIEDERRRREN